MSASVIGMIGQPSTAAAAGADAPVFPQSIARRGLLIVAAGALAMTGWAALAPLSGAVMADGVVVADGQRKTVQHQEGGIVEAIHVKDGDAVTAGQALVTLDAVRVGAELDTQRMELDAEQARQARLEAERAMTSAVAYPDELLARRENRRVATLLQRESAAFAAHRHALDEQLALTRQQIGETQQEIAALSASVDATAAAHSIAEKEFKTNLELKEQGFISSVRLMELQRNQADYLAKAQNQQTELAKARERRTELTLKAAVLKSDYAKQAADELKLSSARIDKLREQLRPLADAARRSVITAPIDGIVVDLKLHTIGAALGPREPVLDIAPAKARLIVEARIKPENMEDIRVGSATDVRLTAYKQRDSAMLEGRLIYLGADRLIDKFTNQPYYPAHIGIPTTSIAKASETSGAPVELSAGMGAEVFVKTKGRMALDYWIEPIASGARRALREK